MKYRLLTHSAARTLAGCLAAAVITLAGNSARGVESEHIVSDDVAGNYLAPPANSYVGDIPMSHAGVGCIGGNCSSGNCQGGNCQGGNCGGGGSVIGRSYGRPDLFYNYYTQGYANRSNAQMYLSPLPIPPNVGHTFYTYQPFYPHHMMYPHKDRFHNYYDNGRGMNRTRAVYYFPPVRQAASNLYWNLLRLPR